MVRELDMEALVLANTYWLEFERVSSWNNDGHFS